MDFTYLILLLVILFFIIIFLRIKHISYASLQITKWIRFEFNFYKKDNKRYNIMKSKSEENRSGGDTININSAGDNNTIIGKLSVGQQKPTLVDSDKTKLLEILPKDKATIIHISAINGDNRAILLGQQIYTFLSENGFNNLRGVHTVFVPLTEGVQVIKKEQTEYVILIGLV